MNDHGPLVQLLLAILTAALYAILSDDPKTVRQEAERAIKQNLCTHLKVKLYGNRDVIKAARDIFGDEAYLIGDVNRGNFNHAFQLKSENFAP